MEMQWNGFTLFVCFRWENTRRFLTLTFGEMNRTNDINEYSEIYLKVLAKISIEDEK